MKKHKIGWFLLCLLVCLTGCGGSDEDDTVVVTQPIIDGDYQIAMPFSASTARQTHIEFNNGRIANIDYIGEGLLRYAKEHFSTSSYYLQEGQLLDRDALQVATTMEDKEGILGFKSEDNPYGLNPENGSSIPVNETTTIKAGTGSHKTIPVIDVFEVDFVQDLKSDAEIRGVAVAIVLNPTIVDENGKEYTMEDAYLQTLGEEAGRNLVTYLKSLPEVDNDTPIMVALFKQDNSEASLPGSYFAVGYGTNTLGTFHEVEELWAIVPSQTATEQDSQLASEFTAVKNALFQFLPNDIAISGQGLFVEHRIDTLRITVTTQTRTHTENMAVVQYMRELLSNFSGNEYSITVKINSNMETFAMIQREKGSSSTDVIMY